jgi:hypothetical protein
VGGHGVGRFQGTGCERMPDAFLLPILLDFYSCEMGLTEKNKDGSKLRMRMLLE